MSERLFWVVAAIAVVATVAGVLALQRSGSDDDGNASAVKNEPALLEKMQLLSFYDWEASVIGPRGRPEPGDAAVTGGPDAGRASALPYYDAVHRAAARPADNEPDNARPVSFFYAVDRARRQVFGRGAPSSDEALADAPAERRAGAAVLEVKPGTAVIRAETTRDRWYVIEDDVALRGREIKAAQRGTDTINDRPVIIFDFTDAGITQFRELTRGLASRGARSSLERVEDDPALHNQHFAVVYGDVLVTTPFVDFRRSPDGLDARSGSQLSAELP
ncbi:MAG TPA: hypothetical protein VMY78_01110 [Solirubrobacteraceae bacterium]|nr:hypothetical protein [Solirubrobacteraceae bacterium]